MANHIQVVVADCEERGTRSYLARWCNGSTRVFGAFSSRSNRDRAIMRVSSSSAVERGDFWLYAI